MRVVLMCSLVGCLLWMLGSPGYGRTGEEMYETLILSAAQGQGVEPALVKAVIKC